MTRGVRLVIAVGLGVSAGLIPAGAGRAEVSGASADDPENQLWDCGLRRVAFGDPAVDALRCLTFRFDPPDDITSAVLYLDIDAPTNSLQDTDALVVAVGSPFEECVWGQGAMAGCVVVHGGFQGGERSLVVDLADLGCDASAPVVDPARQQALLDQLATGVVHVMLQDDTAVNGAWLDVNGGPAPAACGTRSEAVPAAVVREQAGPPGEPTDPGGRRTAATVVIALAVVAAVTAAAATAATASRRARLNRRGVPRVEARRRLDPGVVELNGDQHGSVVVSVRAAPDHTGTLELQEEGT